MAAQSRWPRVDGASRRASGNGRLICTIVDETAGAAIFCAAGDQLKWLPRLINNENGRRNLNDAVSHNQNRIPARLFRKTMVRDM